MLPLPNPLRHPCNCKCNRFNLHFFIGCRTQQLANIMTQKKSYPKFALSTDFSTAVPTKWDDVKALMNSAQVKNICMQLQQLDPNLPDYGKQKEALKK